MLPHARPDRRSGGLHAALRPRPRRRARPRRAPRWSWSPASFPTARCPASRGYEVTELFYRRSSGDAERQAPAAALRAAEHVPGHAPPPPPRARRPTSSTTSGCRSRGSTAACSPTPPARLHDALAPPGAGQPHRRRRCARCSRGWTRSSCTPSTARSGSLADFGVDPATHRGDPARRLRLPDPPARRAAAARRARGGARAR